MNPPDRYSILSFGYDPVLMRIRTLLLENAGYQTVEVFSPDGTTRILDESEILFDDVVPGFEIPVRVIFE